MSPLLIIIISMNQVETIGVKQLYQMFPGEDSCFEWLERERWNGEPVCPHCGGLDNISAPPPSKPHHYWHKDCRKHFTVTTGTCMHATKMPLQDWIFAIYSLMTARKSVSAMQLSKELQCQYKTAWFMLHRLRESFSSGEFRLAKVVEVDETFIGGRERNKHFDKKLKAGRGAVGKVPVVGARERGGRVVAEPVEKTDRETLVGFILDHTEESATVYTDDSSAYFALDSLRRHGSVRHSSGEYVCGKIHTNGIESVWAVLKRSIMGTWHHVSRKHLSRYVNEVTFRLNEGNCAVDTLDRMASVARRMGGTRICYQKLVS